MKYSIALVFSLSLCLLSQALAETFTHDYEAEHADIAMLVQELEYLSQQAVQLQVQHQNSDAPLAFNYAKLIQILKSESAEIKHFLNLKYQIPNIVLGSDK